MNSPRIALITGAGSGIGKACALALLEAGWQLMMTGRNLSRLEATRKAAGELASRIDIQISDVRNPESVNQLFEKVRERFGRLDLLFNNAGTSAPPIALEDLTHAQWQQVLDTNLTGAFLCTQAAFRLMKSQTPMGGRIINNGSISAHVPRPNSAPYSASKHGMTGLTRATSLDGRKYNIACGQIDIGNAATDMAAPMQAGILQASGQRLVEPVMDVRHVAAAVVQMAGLPLESNVQFMTIMATQMPYIGRG